MQTLKEGWSDASHKRPRTEPFTFALVGSDASREVAVSGEMVWKQSPILWDMLRLSEDKKLSVELSSTDLYYVISFWYDGFLALEESNVVAIAHFCDKYDVNSLEKPLIKSLTSHVFGSKPLSFFKDLYDKCRQIPRLRRAILQKLVKDLSVKVQVIVFVSLLSQEFILTTVLSVQEASEEYAFTTASEDAWILFQSQDDCTHKLLEYMTYFHIWVKRKEVRQICRPGRRLFYLASTLTNTACNRTQAASVAA